MPIENVKIPREVAEAIESTWCVVGIGLNKKHITLNNWNYLFTRCHNKNVQTMLDFAKENPIAYMTALVDGYEVEKTKEEYLLEYFKKSTNVQHVIIRTLDTLDIKIEGINS